MGFERERCLRGDPKDRADDNDEFVQQRLDELQAVWPGKHTQVEIQLAKTVAEAIPSRSAVGRRSLLDPAAPSSVPASHASIIDLAASPRSGSQLVFDGFRSRGLREVLEVLRSIGEHGLVEATRSAAKKATRPALPSLTSRPSPPDPAGQAMWQAAERHAATLYRRAVDRGEIQANDQIVEQALARIGGGQPLPAGVRREFEIELGIALDRVRIHTDAAAAAAAGAVRARAFTVGEDIFFAEGEYAPESPGGQHLLAHELTHVLQGYRGLSQSHGSGMNISDPSEPLEREAEAVADRIGESRRSRAGGAQQETDRPVRANVGVATEEAIAALAPRLGLEAGGLDVRSDDEAERRTANAGASGLMEAGVVYLRPDRYDPATERGRYLLAHELAHVAQSRLAPGIDGPAGRGAAEAEAACIGNAWSRGESFAAPAVPLPASTAAADTDAEQMAKARPTAQSDFVMHIGNDDFVVSFELLAGAGISGEVRMVLSPRDFSRAYQSQMKYWDVRGREVDKDDSYVSMGNHSVPAAPWIQQVAIADRTRFNPVMKEYPEAGATAWTFDWNGDTKPEFAIRIESRISNIFRAYNFTTSDNNTIKKFDFHFIQDDAWKYGYQGNISPRRQKDDFFDFLGDILTSKTTWEMAITMIPVVGEIVLLGEALTGYTIFGDKMSTTERVVAGLAALLPVAAGAVAKGLGRGSADLAKVAAKVGRSEEEVMALLRAAEKQGAENAAVKEWSSTLKAGGKLTAEETARLQRMIRQIEADERAFRAEEQAARRATRSGEGKASAVEAGDAAKLGRTVSQQTVELLGQSHTLRIVDRGNGTFSLVLCSDCGFVLQEIDAILAQTAAKGPTKSLRVRLERLRAKVAELESKMATGAMKQTEGVPQLNQIAAHLGDISKKFPSANKLCVFCSFKGELDYDLMAKNLGFERIGERAHGQPVYRRGREYISPDVDRHNGGIWKKATGDAANLRNKTLRDGTFNEDLTEMVGP